MTFGLMHHSYILPEHYGRKLVFFALWKRDHDGPGNKSGSTNPKKSYNNNYSSYCVIVRMRVVLKRTVVGD